MNERTRKDRANSAIRQWKAEMSNRIPGEETSKSDIPPLEVFGLQERVLNSQFYERQAPPRLSPTSSGLPPCGFLYIFSASKNSFLPDRETQPEPSQVSA